LEWESRLPELNHALKNRLVDGIAFTLFLEEPCLQELVDVIGASESSALALDGC